jgi:hypothetical protein
MQTGFSKTKLRHGKNYSWQNDIRVRNEEDPMEFCALEPLSKRQQRKNSIAGKSQTPLSSLPQSPGAGAVRA